MSSTIADKVLEQLKTLPYELQWRVLEFTRSLAISAPRGIPGRQLLSFAGTIQPDDLQVMGQVIEDNCEQVDVNGW